MKDFIIRDCLEEDLVQVAEIERVSFDDPYPYRLFAAFLNDFREGFRVAEKDREVIGYCILTYSTETRTMIVASIAIQPEFRGIGIGRELLRDVIDLRSKLPALNDVNKIALQVSEGNSPARKLYDEFGFRSVRTLKNYYGRGKDGIHMELKIP